MSSQIPMIDGTGFNLIETLRQMVREEIRAHEAERVAPPTAPTDKEELSVKQLARLKGVSQRTVYEWVKDGKVKYHYNTPGRQLRFYRSDVA